VAVPSSVAIARQMVPPNIDAVGAVVESTSTVSAWRRRFLAHRAQPTSAAISG